MKKEKYLSEDELVEKYQNGSDITKKAVSKE